MAQTVGDVLPFGVTVRDASGALANATTMTLTVTLPDGTAAAGSPFTVTPTSTGTYGYDLPSTQVGRYVGYWQSTGLNAGAFTQVFDVAAAASTAIVSLDDVKAQLNLSTTTSDAELVPFIAAATRVVEKFVGPVVVRSYAERVSASRPFVSYLPRIGPGLTPLLTLTSVVPLYTTGVSSWGPGNIVLDPNTGELRQISGLSLYGGPWTVTYLAGQQVVDPAWQMAALIIVQHLWETQRGASSLPLQPTDDAFVPGAGFAIPYRAMDLLKLDAMPGLA